MIRDSDFESKINSRSERQLAFSEQPLEAGCYLQFAMQFTSSLQNA